MWTIFRYEINNLFSSLIAYIVIGVFIVFLGLMLFVFPDFSILDAGYASLDTFFDLVPSILLFIIPALTMRSFSEERQLGTFQLLRSKPVKISSIVLGKFLAAMTLITFALLLTLFYYYTVYELGLPRGIIDSGAVMASYLGLLLLSGAFTFIGLFASSLTDNQIISFLLALLGCFIFYFGFSFISELPIFYGKSDLFIQKLGIEFHYYSLSKGVLDTRDILYFLSLAAIFYLMTKFSLSNVSK